ncbi:MAG: PorP/SprF family type IX secretion system membrane protein [Saprospiraceae bacterium]|jgi:type IX secretion system PorP/SprF family membrane protein|nr:PorP/SprF family type IX secretion system membrane protein [Saprospiraceae bacterium]
MKTRNIFSIFLLLAGLVGFMPGLQAQSRYFDERYIYTQAQLNPQLINPGAIGSAMKHQILLNYRNKWSGIDGAPRTATISYNGPVGNRLGLGVNIVSDRFGELETTKGALGLSYTIKSETNQVGFGISAEYIKHSLSGFGNSNPNDPIINLALAGAEYFDASFGVYGIYMDRLTYGLSLPSAVSSRISDIDNNAPDRDLGFILQFGYKIDVHSDITMTPSLIMKKLANVPTHIDMNLNFGFLQDKLIGGVSYTLGADKRLGFLIGTKIEKFNFYYSYNTSSNLIQDYNNGSHELTLGVNFGGK